MRGGETARWAGGRRGGGPLHGPCLPQGDDPEGLRKLKGHLATLFAASGLSLEDTFRRFDEDGDGSVDRGEFERGLTALTGEALPRRALAALVELLDKDGDGSIDYLEFARWFGLEPVVWTALEQVECNNTRPGLRWRGARVTSCPAASIPNNGAPEQGELGLVFAEQGGRAGGGGAAGGHPVHHAGQPGGARRGGRHVAARGAGGGDGRQGGVLGRGAGAGAARRARAAARAAAGAALHTAGGGGHVPRAGRAGHEVHRLRGGAVRGAGDRAGLAGGAAAGRGHGPLCRAGAGGGARACPATGAPPVPRQRCPAAITVVAALTLPGSLAPWHGAALQVGGAHVAGMTYPQVLEVIRGSPARPLTLRFNKLADFSVSFEEEGSLGVQFQDRLAVSEVAASRQPRSSALARWRAALTTISRAGWGGRGRWRSCRCSPARRGRGLGWFPG
eukprot:COSAG01_NODE_41_length_32446_cov_41.218877_40_plen_448_part_00